MAAEIAPAVTLPPTAPPMVGASPDIRVVLGGGSVLGLSWGPEAAVSSVALMVISRPVIVVNSAALW